MAIKIGRQTREGISPRVCVVLNCVSLSKVDGLILNTISQQLNIYAVVKKLLGLRLNKELYLCYFIMYMTLLYFYKDSSSYQFREYVKSENIIDETSKYLADITKKLDVLSTDEVEQDSFKAIALLWDELPAVTGNQEGDSARASKASRAGYVKLVFNFMSAQRLFVENADRYYPTDRMKALSENYFEEYRGRLYQLLGGEEEDA